MMAAMIVQGFFTAFDVNRGNLDGNILAQRAIDGGMIYGAANLRRIEWD